MRVNQILGRGYDDSGKIRPFNDQEFFQVSDEIEANQLSENYRNSFKKFANWIKETLDPKSALEIGSGPGYLLNCLNELDIDATGFDGNKYSRALFTQEHPKYSEKYFIDKLFERAYKPADIFIAIEVFEHIHDEGIHSIMKKISHDIKPKHIIFSSTPYADPNPGWDLMWGHCNMKTESQWIEIFEQYGFEPVKKEKVKLAGLLKSYKQKRRLAKHDKRLSQNFLRPPITDWAILFKRK